MHNFSTFLNHYWSRMPKKNSKTILFIMCRILENKTFTSVLIKTNETKALPPWLHHIIPHSSQAPNLLFFSMNVFSFHNPNTTFPKSTDKGNVIRCTFLVNTAELSTVGQIQGHSSQQVKYKVREVNRSV